LIDNALQGVHRGAALTQRMLAFARRQDLTAIAVQVPLLVSNMLEMIERTLGPAWSIDSQFPEDLPSVIADPNQLELAILNLAVNARDAMSEGGAIVIAAQAVQVGANLLEDLDEGPYLKISVIDTGAGMDAQTLERAMEPFFTTKGVGKGTGLGLSMIHGLARQLGGTFTLESEPGEGTSASLWLPASDETAELALDPEPDQDFSLARHLKILVVDDDGLILMNTAALLEDLGHSVIEAGSGEEALALFAEHLDIDLVVTDEAMPGMKGSQLAERVDELRPHIPLILATGYGELPQGFRKTVIKLNKPFNQSALQNAVAEAMAGADHGALTKI
jgi:CheY-like chemotaxis protein